MHGFNKELQDFLRYLAIALKKTFSLLDGIFYVDLWSFLMELAKQRAAATLAKQDFTPGPPGALNYKPTGKV